MMRTSLALATLAAILGAGIASAAPRDWDRLEVGLVAEVSVERKARGWVAQDVDIRSGNASTDVEIIGRLEDVRAGGRVLQILGGECEVVSGTQVTGQLVAGIRVEIDGTLDDDRIVARRVKVLPDDSDDVEIEGPLTAADPASRRFAVAGFPVLLSRGTEIRGGGVVSIVRFVDDEEEGRSLLRPFGDRLRIGGRFGAEVEPEIEFDLNPGAAGNFTTSTWYLEVAGESRVHERLDLRAKISGRGQDIMSDEEGDELGSHDWRLAEAQALWHVAPTLALQIGRQKFKEEREWLYDETLDAIRLHSRLHSFHAEASVSRRWSVDSARLKDWTNYIAVVGRTVADRWVVEASVVQRRHDELPDRPTWLGLRSAGRLSSRFRHWADFSILRGEYDGADRKGYAFDVGVRARLEKRTRLTLTAGWAVGSGGNSPEDLYFQTGLQDNNDKFGGVKGFKYYGELFEPELSNLSIRIVGLGLRPTSHSSIDVIWHGYEQETALGLLARSNLETRPRGIDPSLGSEWDFVVAWEDLPGLDLAYVFAWFRPGDAFAADASDARYHQLVAQYRF
ncbi:MAG: alginate export family protein [Gemmatimonadetes bacterium]|nr:alginate export family protein [Gemmatimonadota bacterium]